LKQEKLIERMQRILKTITFKTLRIFNTIISNANKCVKTCSYVIFIAPNNLARVGTLLT